MARAAVAHSADVEVKSERREQILRVTSALLREKGSTISLQDIADELGVTYNALYHHFKSREDLIFHTLSRAASLMHDTLVARATGPGTGLDKVLGFLNDFWKVGVKERTPSGLMVLNLSPEAQQTLSRQTAESHALLMTMIEEGIADKSIVKCDPLVATTMVLHTVYWWPHELDQHRKPAMIAKSVIDMTRRSLAAK